ncbi:MAG: hypothetical protein ACD_79C00982G0001 [uncultured bacterium]|nr:MAG: hypothetical protein ACD_79C00982G0001 [uncultured bacterium]
MNQYIKFIINYSNLILGKVSLIFSILLSTLLCYSEENHEKIVSLNTAFTEAAYVLGKSDKLIACTTFCKSPSGDSRIIKIANVLNANYEQILYLKPDLVVLSGLTSRNTMQFLDKFKISYKIFYQEKSFKDICDNFIAFGTLLGCYEKALEIVNDSILEVENLKLKNKSIHPKIFMQIGSDPLFTANDNMYLDDLIDYSGAVNIGKDSKIGYFSTEEVLLKNPDFIIISTMGATAIKDKEEWKRFECINAVKKNNVYIFDPYALCIMNPKSFVTSLKELSRILHG